ncbi:glycosyltransferase family 2 protein, partial [Patescibacteria group bacterium]|nr:glycosyltransferase family 2 protein [Patescibacteria group bacterium]
KNLGFTGGNNIGIKQAKGEILFLLNDDTKIHPNLIEVLVKELKSSSKIGIVGPKIYFMDEPKKIWFAGGRIDWFKGKTFHLGKNLTDKELINDSKKEVDFITGCALMIKKEVVDRIGLFDDKFFAYYEDADLCQRAKKIGYQIIYVPFGGVWHVKSATASNVFMDDIQGKYFKMLGRYLKFSIFLKWKNYRNRFVFFMRYAKFIYKITFLIKFIFVFTPKFLWMITGQALISLIKIAKKHIYEF